MTNTTNQSTSGGGTANQNQNPSNSSGSGNPANSGNIQNSTTIPPLPSSKRNIDPAHHIFFPTSDSLKDESRPRRTHNPDAVIPFLKRLSVEEKCERNRKIEQDNRRRLNEMIEHQSGSRPNPPSPSASFISLSEPELTQLARDKTLFERVKSNLAAESLAYIQRKVEELKLVVLGKRSRGSLPDELDGMLDPEKAEAVAKLARLLPRFEEVPYNPGKARKATIPRALYDAGKHVNLPIGFFTDKNLFYIETHLHSLPTTKHRAATSSATDYILDIKAVSKLLGIDESARNENLTYQEFREVADNNYEFESTRDEDGVNGSRAHFTSNHFSFFLNHPESHDMYDWWKPRELKLRNDRIMYKAAFSLEAYNLVWSEIVMGRDTELLIEASVKKLRDESRIAAVKREVPTVTAWDVRNKVTGSMSMTTQSTGPSSGESYQRENLLRRTEIAQAVSVTGSISGAVDVPAVKTRMYAHSAVPQDTTPSVGLAEASQLDHFLQLCTPPILLYHDFADFILNRPPLPNTPLDYIELYNRIVTPYNADEFERLLDLYHLSAQYPILVHNLRHGFPLGKMPLLTETIIMDNDRSVLEHPDIVSKYLSEEALAGRMAGPFSQDQVFQIMRGHFPQGPSLPPKFRVCRNLSKDGRYKDGRIFPSINSHVEKELFPTRFDTAPKVAEVCEHARYVGNAAPFYVGNVVSPHVGNVVLPYVGNVVSPMLGMLSYSMWSMVLFHPCQWVVVLFYVEQDATNNIALAPPGTQACTLDIEKFHRTCPVNPHHKPYLVVCDNLGQFWTDNCTCFGASPASSNAGMISNAVVDIWRAAQVTPVFKYEDDLKLLRFPSGTTNIYRYDKNSALDIVRSLGVRWHPNKGDDDFTFITTYIGFLWDLALKRVSLPNDKRLKYLERIHLFLSEFSGVRVPLFAIESIHGTLCHISFVYPEGRSHLPALSNFMASFRSPHEESRGRYPSDTVLMELQWWLQELEKPNHFRQLKPKGPLLDHGIYVDASTEWGIGIVFEGRWAAFRLRPGWKIFGRDICWLETVAVELLFYFLESWNFQDVFIRIHSDNQGTIGTMEKVRSPNFWINMSIRRICSVVYPLFIIPDMVYVRSADNLADPYSRGILGPANSKIPLSFELPDELIDRQRFSGFHPRLPAPLLSRPSFSPSDPNPNHLPLSPAPRIPAPILPPSTPSSATRQDSSWGGEVFAISKRKQRKGHEIAVNALRPNVKAPDRLLAWSTPYSRAKKNEEFSSIPRHILDEGERLIGKALAGSTRSTYGAGLKEFHRWCDRENIAESSRMPAPEMLIVGFVAAHSGSVAGKTINSWLSAIRAWHVLHRAPWPAESFCVKYARKAARIEGSHLTRPRRNPITLQHLLALYVALDLTKPFHCAVWAVALLSFWGCRRLGELTVPGISKFDPKFHVSRLPSIDAYFINHDRKKIKFHIPWTKTTFERGADFIASQQPNVLCPCDAFRLHWKANSSVPEGFSLFGYIGDDDKPQHMVKSTFWNFVNDIWKYAGLLNVLGHSFRIGGAVELLLAGYPPHVVACIGGWNSLAFLVYWRQIEEIVMAQVDSAEDARWHKTSQDMANYCKSCNISEKMISDCLKGTDLNFDIVD
ncbi:hypothetical protein D9757_009423 [Collybiopsis confluens]|uniref:Uncharacterized protein n=1 Tax=Collybiopsis confluens TaxID=2823264 RepID=A0A8H5HDA8_9AGAR|nr:hypothetical protein D9757_009423 [Collybiopsis confluens]